MMPTSLLLWVLTYISGVVLVGGEEYSPTSVSTHVDTLLAEYDREVPPAPRVVVTVSFDVRHAAVSEAAATMRVLADLNMNWSDPRLAWNSSTFGESSVLVPTDRLWRPDVDAVGATALHGSRGMDTHRARLSADGSVATVSRLDVTVPVPLNLERWPQDEHEAVYKFASREYSQDELYLVVSSFETALVMEHGIWDVVSVSGEASSWSRGEGSVAGLAQWAVVVARRGVLLRVTTGASALAAALLLLAALARPYAHRATLAAAAAVLTAGWMMSTSHLLPGAPSTPRSVVAAAWGCALAGAAALGAAAAAFTAARTAPPPAPLRALLSKVSALYPLTPHTEANEADGVYGAGAWYAAAQLLDAALVAVLLLALLALTVYYCC